MADWWIDESLPVGPAVEPAPPLPFGGQFSQGGLNVADKNSLEVISFPYGKKPIDIGSAGAQVWVSPGGYVNTTGHGKPATVVANAGMSITVRYN